MRCASLFSSSGLRQGGGQRGCPRAVRDEIEGAPQLRDVLAPGLDPLLPGPEGGTTF